MAAQPVHLSVKVVVRDAEGQRLLLQRSRQSKGNPGKWEFPGGKVDPAERVDEALLREVREEAGLTIALDEVVGAAQSELLAKAIAYVFLDARMVSGPVQLSPEHEEARWVTLDELLRIGRGEVPGVQLAPQYRPFVEQYCRQRGYSAPQAPSLRAPPIDAQQLSFFVSQYRNVLPRYSQFAREMERILRENLRPVCPCALIQARPKSIASFAEKILRKNKYTNPLTQITDLCGARVITQIKPEVDEVCAFVRRHFLIDEANSLDAASRLRANEFGYRSVHYIVQFKRGEFQDVPEELYGLTAELQVRTILQHAWSDVGHDRLYKSEFKVPEIWQREASRVAAMLESADDTFARTVRGLEEYRSDVGAYLDTDQRAKERAILEAVLAHEPGNANLVLRLARLALAEDKWEKAIQIIRGYTQPLNADLLCCLGVALCNRHRVEPSSPGFAEGISFLRKAIEKAPDHAGAHLRLAEFTPMAAEKRRHYQMAFDLDPTNPEALSAYVRHKLVAEKTTAFIPLLRPMLEAGIEKCRAQARADVEIPAAYYRIAGFNLLLGPDRAHESLVASAQAVARTTAPSILDTAIAAAEALSELEPQRRDVTCVLRFLLAARHARFPGPDTLERLQSLRTARARNISGPAVIIAGGCDKAHEAQIGNYRSLLAEALHDFAGTVISGGTREGVSGIVGEIGRRYADRIRNIGYLPGTLPADGSATRDERYHDLRNTDGKETFSALEPLQNWLDLLASGVSPDDVRVIGINGGRIAALEYRVAWALGARVAIVRDSGREADILEQEIKAQEFNGILVVPHDAMTLRAFLHTGGNDCPFTPGQQERLARLAHARYLEQNRHKPGDRTMREWDYLDDDIKQSNREQITYMVQILRAVGCNAGPATDGAVRIEFNKEELETMGRMEHGRWNVERLRQGWHFGKDRIPEKRLSPCIIPWNELAEGVKDGDRRAVAIFGDLLGEIGMQIVRLEPAGRAVPAQNLNSLKA